MKYFTIEPEVSGELGSLTEMDTSIHPPVVSRLEYRVCGWLGDALLECFPCFIGTVALIDDLVALNCNGFDVAEMLVTESEELRELQPNLDLPEFRWIQVTGTACRNDFGLDISHQLVVSERVLSALKRHGFANAIVVDV